MPLIDRIDGPNRLVYLTAETAGTVLDLQELYREERALRRVDEALRRHPKFMVMEGNIPKGGGKFTERYLVLLGGTKIIPWDVDSTVAVTTTLIGDDGSAEGPGQFDRSGTASNVDISYSPDQVEVRVIEPSTGGGGDCPPHAVPIEVALVGSTTTGAEATGPTYLTARLT